MKINSKEYWEYRFKSNWIQNKGDKQTIAFCMLFIYHSPPWLKKELENKLTFLDIGCAFGDCCNLIKSKFPKLSITGIDIAKNPIEFAKLKFKNKANFENIGIDEINKKYDIVYCSNVLEHFKDYRDKLKKMLKITKKHLILLIPFQEKNLISEHQASFNYQNFFLKIDSFFLSFFKIIDFRTIDNEYKAWADKQIIVIYTHSSQIKNITLSGFSYLDFFYKDYFKLKIENKNLKLTLKKIYNGRIWRFLQLYFTLRDKILKFISLK